MHDMFLGIGDLDDNIRMLTNVGAKFAGRAVLVWGQESQLPTRLSMAEDCAQDVHTADPEIILQAGIFEIVTTEVESLPVPAWVFEEFDLPVRGHALARWFRGRRLVAASVRARYHPIGDQAVVLLPCRLVHRRRHGSPPPRTG